VVAPPPPDAAPPAEPGVAHLDPAEIKRVIQRNTSQIKYCYERALVRDPSLGGKVTAQFSIRPNGTVVAAKASGVDSGVASCIAAVIEKLQFPKPTGNGLVSVSYPFIFRNDAKDPPEPTPTTPPDKGSGSGDAFALAEEARNAAKASQWGKARSLCEQALKVDPANTEAVLVCSLAACYLKDVARAKKYINQLSGGRQTMARQSCLRNGVTLD
jgi:hypothetical protein